MNDFLNVCLYVWDFEFSIKVFSYHKILSIVLCVLHKLFVFFFPGRVKGKTNKK